MKHLFTSGSVTTHQLHMTDSEYKALRELLSTLDMNDIVTGAAEDIFDTSTHSSDDIAQRIHEVIDCQMVHHFVTVICK